MLLPLIVVFGLEAMKAGKAVRAEQEAIEVTEQRQGRRGLRPLLFTLVMIPVGVILAVFGAEEREDVAIVAGMIFIIVGALGTIVQLVRRRSQRQRVGQEVTRIGTVEPQARSMAARIVWRFIAAGLLTTALICVGIAMFDLTRGDDLAITISVAVGAGLLMAFAWHKSTPMRRAGIWEDTIRPLLLTGFFGMGVISLMVLMVFNRGMRDDETMIGFGFIVASVVFGTFVYRLRSHEIASMMGPDATSDVPVVRPGDALGRDPEADRQLSEDETVTLGPREPR